MVFPVKSDRCENRFIFYMPALSNNMGISCGIFIRFEKRGGNKNTIWLSLLWNQVLYILFSKAKFHT
ncbi:hypothetical protein BX666DRAFT_1993062 [Dichotomocladium elegans]|nr:hypothetical protein BX666DRAFT_1993062 [Dichotomocladium elegans]